MAETGSIQPDEILPAGTRLGKYELVRRIGGGGMGAVYEALHVDIGKRVAVKTLSRSVADATNARQRFLREAQLTSRLRHPHVVDLTDMGREGPVAYLVMELLTGEDLGQRLERTGPFAARELVDIMLPVCSALVAAHEAGIVHRDLKPRNIFLAAGPSGVHPKVLDFGISKSVGGDTSALTSSGVIIGTPHYLAPEQTHSARLATPASDQYALGVILYRCLTGRNPFDGPGVYEVLKAIAEEVPVPLRSLRADLPPGFERVVERAMRRVGWDRYPTVSELGRALLPYASERARLTWQEAFGPPPAQEQAATPNTRDSHTLPNPVAMQPVARPAQAVAITSGREESRTLPPAVSDASLTDRPRRRSLTVTGLLGAVLALGAIGYVLATYATRATLSNPASPGPTRSAAGAPAAPVAAAPVAPPPPPPPPVAAPAAPAPAPEPTEPTRTAAPRRNRSAPPAKDVAPAPETPAPKPGLLNPNKAPVID